jgi:hypothetical protein
MAKGGNLRAAMRSGGFDMGFSFQIATRVAGISQGTTQSQKEAISTGKRILIT